MSVAVEGLRKAFRGEDQPAALDGVTLEVGEGEFLVVVGPSGSGKSTLLRAIAGLEEVDEGRVLVGGRDVTDVHPRDRDVALVFQDYALYPHLSVEGNISFPLRARKVEAEELRRRVTRAVEMLDLGDLLDRLPNELSGGERRRVSLARAVVRDPAAFLMDEPLSNLDAGLRWRIRDSIRELQEELGTTTLYVTHDQMEAMSLGHRVALLRDGRVEQVGTPMELYDHPRNTFVAEFVGQAPMNLWPGTWLGAPGEMVGVRPEHLRITDGEHGRLQGWVTGLERLGEEVLVDIDTGDSRARARVSRDGAPEVGQRVGLDYEDRHRHVFDAHGDAKR